MNSQMNACVEMLDKIRSRQPITGSKESYFECWLAFQFLGARAKPSTRVLQSRGYRRHIASVRIHEPRSRVSFRGFLPSKAKRTQGIFSTSTSVFFFAEALGEESFASLLQEVDEKHVFAPCSQITSKKKRPTSLNPLSRIPR
jgi:hypothetical protein